MGVLVDASASELGGSAGAAQQFVPVPGAFISKTQCRLYVGKLPSGVTEKVIVDALSPWGAIVDVYIKSSPPAPSYAFVTFSDKKEADAAIAAHGRCRLRIGVTLVVCPFPS